MVTSIEITVNATNTGSITIVHTCSYSEIGGDINQSAPRLQGIL